MYKDRAGIKYKKMFLKKVIGPIFTVSSNASRYQTGLV